jgi:hypothetical protein
MLHRRRFCGAAIRRVSGDQAQAWNRSGGESSWITNEKGHQ